MKVLGLDIIESFLASCADQQCRDALTAFVCELRHRRWADAETLLIDYPQAELGELPEARFRLANNTLFIEAMVHLEGGVVLLTRCDGNRHRGSDSGDQTEWEAA